MKHLSIYTDGSCSGNGQHKTFGGYAFEYVFSSDNEPSKTIEKLISAPCMEERTTNNRMELKAVIEAIRGIKPQHLDDKEISIYTDSQYVVAPITDGSLQRYYSSKIWICKSTKKPVANAEMWQELCSILMDKKRDGARFKFILVPGHAGDVHNERVNAAAQMESQKLRNNEKGGACCDEAAVLPI